MLLQEGPADTFSYMVSGFIVIIGSIVFYLASLINRTRNLRRDKEALSEMEGITQFFEDD